MNIAVVGATGLVGQKILQVISERQFNVNEIIPVASLKSYNKSVIFKNKEYFVHSIQDAIEKKPEIVIFSAGSEVSLEYAPIFASNGSFVIDNSSAWRMDCSKKLIVPEINGHILTFDDKIIANPNCSTIQLVMALAPLHFKFKIKRVIISTYQSVTGSGMKAINQLKSERSNLGNDKFYPYRIDMNTLPHCDFFLENDYTKEEMKLVNETRKILGDNNLMISATAVRVPVVGGHSESVNVEFEKNFEISEIRSILSATKGVVVQDNPAENIYPMPLNSYDKDEVFVGRIRRDLSNHKALNMWIVADNLRKGAATNAVQIAEIVQKFVKH
ncbi:MAG: aspartate-semialdehyde dehydrogenase [Bacteroidales bacterium]|nr:aspartate-semialdehyde dehydrogenase [Bacteroidales bacterium]